MPSASTSSRRNSILISAAIAIAFVVWIASGLGRGLAVDSDSAATNSDEVMRVTVRHSRAETTRRTIEVSGRTEPDRVVELKAETEGRVMAIGFERGAFVKAGQPLVELDIRDRQARLDEAAALVRQRELEFEAATRLKTQGFMSDAELAAANALLESARAAHSRIELDIARTHVRAPFDAAAYDRLVEIGDYVGIGDSIAQLVDADPLIVVGNINERDIHELTLGSTGSARVLGGRRIEGTIRYISPVADESTRTFRVELAIPNPGLTMRAGTSAELILGADTITAHMISPALLALSDDGTIGVKIVDDTDHVRFIAVDLPMSTNEGMFVTGLPMEARVITVGQGFVSDGQLVVPVEEAGGAWSAEDERIN